ncbi:MAG: hypothetical protein R2699_01395 [Acidimicrobiales bacterium]
MTDPTDRTLADDDLVSAYLDAEVDETERPRRAGPGAASPGG